MSAPRISCGSGGATAALAIVAVSLIIDYFSSSYDINYTCGVNFCQRLSWAKKNRHRELQWRFGTEQKPVTNTAIAVQLQHLHLP
jgi:hypothetical protein